MSAFTTKDLAWVIGAKVLQVRMTGSGWEFRCDRAWFEVECPWRIIGPDGMCVTRDDHGRKWGRKPVIDAAAEASELVVGRSISMLDLDDGTLDLTVTLENGIRIQFIRLSTLYECWHLRNDNGLHAIATGYGKMVVFK
ncbi:MAG: hypothetical protein JST66_16080 [Bacteroidetes bacterium]|nr:hypothetical protein [Bacteroidota bacterium]